MRKRGCFRSSAFSTDEVATRRMSIQGELITHNRQILSRLRVFGRSSVPIPAVARRTDFSFHFSDGRLMFMLHYARKMRRKRFRANWGEGGRPPLREMGGKCNAIHGWLHLSLLSKEGWKEGTEREMINISISLQASNRYHDRTQSSLL